MGKKALIFYIFSAGHFHAANAIERGLLEAGEDIDVKKVDVLSYTNPILEKILNRVYLRMIKKRPEVWGHIYDNPDVLKKTKTARETFHKLNRSKIKKLLEFYAPDVIYCTQAFPCGMVAEYKRSSGNNVPLIGVMTDYAPHSYWLYDEVDLYVVPSDRTAHMLQEKGVSRDKIRVYGIPVDPKFKRKNNVSCIREQMGFSVESPMILIMGGSQGLGAVEDVVRSLSADTRHGYQMVVVTGANKKLYSKLKKLKEKNGENICVLSFVENIDELMEASDLIVTKAGGMTIAEAMVKGLPMLIVDPIPGHEQMNTDYLVEKGAAIEIKDYNKIHERMNELFDSKDMLDKMKNNMKMLSKPDSALDIAKLVFER